MLRNHITTKDITPYYITLLSDKYTGTISKYYTHATLISNTIIITVPNDTQQGAYSELNEYTAEIKEYGYCTVLSGYVTQQFINFELTTQLTLTVDKHFGNAPITNQTVYISAISGVMCAAFEKLKNDIVYGTTDIENKISVKGINDRCKDTTLNVIEYISDNDTSFNEALKHCMLYLLLLQNASIANANDTLLQLSRHHYRQYLDALNVAINALADKLSLAGYQLIEQNVVNPIYLARV